MHPEIFELAAAKAGGAQERAQLEALAVLARQHRLLADSFESDINASKAARGEGPTALGRGQREQLAQFAQEADQGHVELLAVLAEVETGREIVEIVFPAMEDDVAFFVQTRRHAHPGDLPVIDAFTHAKATLRDATAGYLEPTAG